MGTGSGWTMSNNVGDNLEHYELIAPLTGPNGDQYWNSSAWFYKLYPNRLCISTKCENIEKAIEFVNLCYDQYNGFQLTYVPKASAWRRMPMATPPSWTCPKATPILSTSPDRSGLLCSHLGQR